MVKSKARASRGARPATAARGDGHRQSPTILMANAAAEHAGRWPHVLPVDAVRALGGPPPGHSHPRHRCSSEPDICSTGQKRHRATTHRMKLDALMFATIGSSAASRNLCQNQINRQFTPLVGEHRRRSSGRCRRRCSGLHQGHAHGGHHGYCSPTKRPTSARTRLQRHLMPKSAF